MTIRKYEDIEIFASAKEFPSKRAMRNGKGNKKFQALQRLKLVATAFREHANKDNKIGISAHGTGIFLRT
jgi:hypothetical protein